MTKCQFGELGFKGLKQKNQLTEKAFVQHLDLSQIHPMHRTKLVTSQRNSQTGNKSQALGITQ